MRRVTALLLASFLSACVHEPDRYPPGWPALRAGAACADIVGAYAEEGERQQHSGERLVGGHVGRLSRLLFPDTDDTRRQQPTGVEIALRNSVYEVRAFEGSKVVNTLKLAESALACDNGWLTVDARSGMPDRGPVAGYEDWAVMLHAAEDGTLLARTSSSITGLSFMVVPMHASGIRYFRFARRQTGSP